MPKVREGGVVSGDDYCKEFPGVIKAVNERFQDKKVVTENGVWYSYKS